MSSTPRRIPVFVERVLLVVASPLLFLLLAEAAIAMTGINTDVARNDNAQIAVPVWLLADEVWVADRRSKWRREGDKPIAAAEVGWLYHFEEARWIGYKMKPTVDAAAVNPFNRVEVRKNVTFQLQSNSSGFRDRPFGPREAGTVRVVTLGDSSTFGWGVDAEHTFQRLLEDGLNDGNGRRVEVLNLGIPGHNSRHGLGMLRHYALALQPDVLIFAYGANDPRKVPTPTDRVLAGDDTLLAGARYRLLRLGTYRLLRQLMFSARDPLRPGTAEIETVTAVPRASFESNLRQFHALSAAAGAETILMSVCIGDVGYAHSTRDVAAELGIAALDVRQVFTKHIDALEAGTLYPDLVDQYRRLYGNLFNERRAYAVTSDGCHPHRVGHRLIADELLPLVRQAIGRTQSAAPTPE
jgi:lysophospholipase L1-like esterase